MDPSDSWLIFVYVISLLLSAAFSAAETALVSLRRARLEYIVSTGSAAAALVQKALDEPERVLASIQATNTTLAMAAMASATVFIDLRWEMPGLLAALILAAVMYLLIGEIVPKTIARRHNERTALLLIRPVVLMSRIVFPVVILLVSVGNLLVRLVPGFQPLTRNPYITEEEIKVLVEKGEELGDLEEDEREMVTAIFDLDRRVAHEVMVPRVDVSAADVNQPLDDVLDLVISRGYSRIPIYEGSLDNVVGVLHAKDLLRTLRQSRNGSTVRAVMRKPVFVPGNKNAKTLLEEMRSRRIHFAIVVDEYGGTAGVVTLEDLIEEIVGEIRDEYDVEEEDIVTLTNDVALVNGKASIEEVNDALDIEIPTEEYDSVGGFLVGLFGYPPGAGEEATWENIRFVVEDAGANRIHLVRILVNRAASEGDQA